MSKQKPNIMTGQSLSEDEDVQIQTKRVVGGANNEWEPQSTAMASYRASGGSSGHGYEKQGPLNGELQNISSGVIPFQDSDGGLSVRDSIILCQKAYWNVAIFRLTVDTATEFCNSALHFKGGNASSRKFYDEWSKSINGWDLRDQFFREWFRSGNVFFYRFDGTTTIGRKRSIPIRYTLLNPADIRSDSAASLIDSSYVKILNDYEIQRLRNPKTVAEIDFKKSLPVQTRKDVDAGNKVSLVLEQERLHAVFAKKQDYEPLAIPMYFPVLFDIDLKLEFKKVEKVIARTTDYLVLLITMGDPNNGGANPSIMAATNELFASESVGRVLVADYSTKADFVMPDLKKILGPEKYEVVNADIASGLMNIFYGEQKFADSTVKISVFMERLNEARRAFLESFLKPEMKRLAEEFGFKSIPEPVFESVNLKDEVQYMKVYTRLAELGILTPEEAIRAMETDQLPDPESSLQSQKDFKEKFDEGYYQPITGGAKAEPGRPEGTKAPQTTKNVEPQGGGAANASFSFESVKDTYEKISKLTSSVSASYKKKNKVKRVGKRHGAEINEIVSSIVCNVHQSNWSPEIIADFVNQPSKRLETTDFSNEVTCVEDKYGVSEMLAGILAQSSTD